MRRRKRDGNHPLPQNNLIQESQASEENGYQVLDSNKTKINDTKEPIMPTKTLSKNKSCK
jgi:hypothetical protein